MTVYAVHLHDGGAVPPRSAHFEAPDDQAAKAWALDLLAQSPQFTHVSVVDGSRLVGKWVRSEIHASALEGRL
jgi:hypothetical protein